MGGVFNHINGNLYHYAGNNPIRYTDPTGMWIDNEDGTYTAEQGDTLWDLYGNDWQEKSGYEGDPTKLQVGDVVGQKINFCDLQKNILEQESPINEPTNKTYSTGANIAIGIGEIVVGGAFYVSSTIAAGGIEIGSSGTGSYYAGMAILEGYATGSLFIANGITRLSGINNRKFLNDITDIFIPTEVDIATSLDDCTKKKKD